MVTNLELWIVRIELGTNGDSCRGWGQVAAILRFLKF
jgi:hypothetical protein